MQARRRKTKTVSFSGLGYGVPRTAVTISTGGARFPAGQAMSRRARASQSRGGGQARGASARAGNKPKTSGASQIDLSTLDELEKELVDEAPGDEDKEAVKRVVEAVKSYIRRAAEEGISVNAESVASRIRGFFKRFWGEGLHARPEEYIDPVSGGRCYAAVLRWSGGGCQASHLCVGRAVSGHVVYHVSAPAECRDEPVRLILSDAMREARRFLENVARNAPDDSQRGIVEEILEAILKAAEELAGKVEGREEALEAARRIRGAAYEVGQAIAHAWGQGARLQRTRNEQCPYESTYYDILGGKEEKVSICRSNDGLFTVKRVKRLKSVRPPGAPKGENCFRARLRVYSPQRNIYEFTFKKPGVYAGAVYHGPGPYRPPNPPVPCPWADTIVLRDAHGETVARLPLVTWGNTDTCQAFYVLTPGYNTNAKPGEAVDLYVCANWIKAPHITV